MSGAFSAISCLASLPARRAYVRLALVKAPLNALLHEYGMSAGAPPTCTCYGQGAAETVTHFALHCTGHDAARAAFLARAQAIAGPGHVPAVDLAHFVVPPWQWPLPQRIKYARAVARFVKDTGRWSPKPRPPPLPSPPPPRAAGAASDASH